MNNNNNAKKRKVMRRINRVEGVEIFLNPKMRSDFASKSESDIKTGPLEVPLIWKANGENGHLN